MSFPLGKPILVMTCLALLAGAATLFQASPPRPDLSLWIFSDLHARMYRNPIRRPDGSSAPPLLQQFQNSTGHSVRADLIAGQAMDVRLMSLFMSGATGAATPDLAEIEIGSVGKFFRPPVDQIGFLPLNDYLKKSGWLNKIVQARFAPWSKGSIIFGVPHDLHPCTLTYRKDLFDQAGVDLEFAGTWPQLQNRCLKFQHYWQAHGHRRMSVGFSTTSADTLVILLQQQHVNLLDADLTIHLTDEKTVQTLRWYAQAVAGPKQFGTDFNPAPGQNVRDLANGDICATITPDWEVGELKQYGKDMAGKLHMIPLPRFSPDDAATASYGGTMIGITRTCQHPDLAWKLIETLYLDQSALQARQQWTSILPPIPQYWSNPVYHQPDPFYGGQKIDELYLNLARELPPQYVTSYSTTAKTILSVILNRAVSHVRDRGAEGLESACRQWLASGAADLKDIITFDQVGMSANAKN
jgi:ABC-type glycerol-3-phosphate transport system substrate-binding protein